MTPPSPVVFLVDVDNTLLNNDRIQDDIKRHLARDFGAVTRDRYPARHYVLVDDKPRITAAVKKIWGRRVTTVLPCQGQYAHDPAGRLASPPPDLVVDRIGDLLRYDLPTLLGSGDGDTIS